MTDDRENGVRFKREYDMLYELQHLYDTLGAAANSFERLAELDLDQEVSNFESDMHNIDEIAEYSVKSKIEDLAWYVQDRDLLVSMGFDTHWWASGSLDELEAYRVERESAREAIDCE